MFKVPNMDGEFLSVEIHTGDETPVKQYFKDECDINNILKNYNQTGLLNHINPIAGDYLDLPDALDLQSSLEIVLQAQTAFADLPATTREAFHNDPVEFLQAVQDPTQKDRLIELGLINKPEAAPAAAPSSPAAKEPPPPAASAARGASGTPE